MLIEGVGIDLGNANTRVAIYRNGGIVIIPDVDGGDSFPSVVAFDSHNQTRLTGSKARSPSSSPSLRVVGNIKRRIRERPYGLANSETLTDHNREREIVSSIEGLAAIFDRVMVNLAVYYKSSLEPLTIRAVINVPALFNEHQRQVIRDAAKVVGIDVLSLIATPNAICYAWALNGGHINTDAEVHILAMDIGAGFFHAGVAAREGKVVEMKAIYHEKLGGSDFDNILLSYLTLRAHQLGISVYPKSRAEYRLRNACRKAIIELSFAQTYHLVLEALADDKTFDIKIDRAMIDEVVMKPLLPRTLAAIDHVLRCSRLRKDGIQEIIATGGCSRIPILREAWTAHFGNKMTIHFLEHAEVTGCALHAALLTGAPGSGPRSHDLGLLLENTPLPIGVGLANGECAVLIPTNTSIPTVSTEVFVWDASLGLVYDQMFPELYEQITHTREVDEVDEVIYFYQGVSSRCRENVQLMDMDLDFVLTSTSKPGSQKRKFQVQVEVDARGRIEVSVAADPGRIKSKRQDLNKIGLTPYGLERLQVRSKQYRANDELEETRKAQRYTIDERLAGLRSLSPSLPQLQEAIDREASWLDDNPSASLDDQKAMLERLDALTELILQHPGPVAEQDEIALFGLEAEQIHDDTFNQIRDEDITIMPRIGPLLMGDSNRETILDDILHHADKQQQCGGATSPSSAPRVHPMVESDHSGNSSVHTITELNSLFSTSSRGERGIYTDANFVRVSVYLRNTGHTSWSATPRLYTALRLVNHIEALDEFLELGLNDMCFPFTNTTVPVSLSPTTKSAFLDIQEAVYSESKSYEAGHGKHVYFSKDDPKPFQTIGLLGRGSHGTVDKVMSQLDHKEYARKLFRRRRGWSQNHMESFRTEVNVLKQVVHTHCVQLISTYSDPKYFALLITPAGDCNLAKYYELAQDSNDKLSLLRGFLGCLTSGVRYLHDSRIRHRDIKPQNVIIKDNQVWLTDFGIAHRWETLAGATTTADSGKTAIYAAPEVIRVEPRNTAADIWSLGCIFFEIATVLSGGSIEDLKAHFRQQTDTEAYHANVDNFAAWVKGLRSSTANKSDNFSWKLAQMALHFDPEDRLTAAELFEEIAKETHRTGIHFCGPCCLDDDASTSGSEAGT